MVLRIDEEFKALIPPLTDEEKGQLESNLKAEGCRDSLIAWEGLLLDGHNRKEICDRHAIAFRVQEIKLTSRDDAKIWIINNQFGRRNLAPYARAELALQLKPLMEAKAKAKQRAHGGTAPGKPKSLVQNSAQVIDTGKTTEKPIAQPSKTREVVAKAAGISHDTLRKAEVIANKAPEEVKEKLRKGQTTINSEFNKIVKEEKKQAVVSRIAAEPPPLPVGPFRVIVADPPWMYAGRAEDPTHRAANPYPSMTIDAIHALPVGDLAHDDCVLWLWTTNAHMREAFAVLDAWGFTHKTILTWVKDRMGTGDWLRGQTEHCLMAIRGKPTVLLTNQTTVINGPLREHSRKPEEFYHLVETICPGSKAELFARRPREGWGQHGGEIDKFL